PSELVHLAEKTKLEEGKTTSFKQGNYIGKHIWFPDFEIFSIKAKSGVHKKFDPRFHGNTAEVCVVLSGRLILTVAGESNELGPGMAYRFKALLDHHFDVIEAAEFLLIHHNITA
ncbi:cupin domain-containing protein, partial [Desulfobacterales bacterium HSG17]|nr:cupin domain-containing protein [Desulfobacterales bacterium HSG17]